MIDDDLQAALDDAFPNAVLELGERLRGGVSAEVRVGILRLASGEERSVVVRKPPDGVGREPALHRALQAAGFPVPAPVVIARSAWAMEYVDGTTAVAPRDVASALAEMADFLARLHATPVADVALPELPAREDARVELLQVVRREDDPELQRRLTAYDFAPARTTLLHGDLWPGNVLWREGRVVAVLDWEDAALGDPLSDVACSRTELVVAYGDEATEAFTERYFEATGFARDDLALWDLFCSRTALAYMHTWRLSPDDEAYRRAVTQRFADAARDRLLRD